MRSLLSRYRCPVAIASLLALTLLVSAACKRQIRPHPVRVPDTQFTFVDPNAKKVFLAGEFNHWNTTAKPMRRDASGKWTVSVPLLPGRYDYKFVADEKWIQDPANPDSNSDDHGGKNSVVTVPDPFADPVVEEKHALRAEAARSFAKSDFAALEKTADELRRTKARFSDGLWKLREFYDGLQARKEMGDEEDWKPWFDKLEAWHSAFPNSITQPVVLANGWADYAWKARGSGYANTVTKKGWESFSERLGKSREILEQAAVLPARCPNWYAVMQNVALGQNWDRDHFLKLVAEAAGAEPTFYSYYANAAYFLLPRWNGARGDWEQFAERAAKEFDPAEGMSAYARTVWFTDQWFGNVFKETAIEWPKLKRGFVDIEKLYPNSRWNLNAFCRFAVEAGDREAANELFARIGDHGDPDWGGYGRYELARIWADPKTPSWQIEPIRTLVERPGKREAVHSIAFSPDGKFIASGGNSGDINLWSPVTGEKIWSGFVSPDPVMSVAFSRDGTLLAAGAGEEYQTTHDGMVKVWNVETKEKIASAKSEGTVWSISFNPDGKTLAISGGWFDKQAAAALLDVATGHLEPLDWTKEHNHGLHCIVFSPDGKAIVTDCYDSITVFSISEKRILFDKRNTLATLTNALAFSPDGKTLVAAGWPSWGHHYNQPGGLTFWNPVDWTQRKTPEQEDAAGLLAVAYSPDGKLIAAAGHDRGVHLWDAHSVKSKVIYVGHDGPIWSVAFSPDGKLLASASEDGTIKIWKVP